MLLRDGSNSTSFGAHSRLLSRSVSVYRVARVAGVMLKVFLGPQRSFLYAIFVICVLFIFYGGCVASSGHASLHFLLLRPVRLPSCLFRDGGEGGGEVSCTISCPDLFRISLSVEGVTSGVACGADVVKLAVRVVVGSFLLIWWKRPRGMLSWALGRLDAPPFGVSVAGGGERGGGLFAYRCTMSLRGTVLSPGG